MSKGVIFFNAGNKHGVHLAVAVASLREHYRGPIALLTEHEGTGRRHCELIAADERLAPISVIPDKALRAGSHGISYYSKTLLPRLSPFEETLFLDADTLTVGDISELWPDPATGEVVLTRFCDWVSTGNKMRHRIEPWTSVEPKRVARQFERKWPALNTGVMAWSQQSEEFLLDWEATTKKRMCFMADELAAQIIFPDYVCRVMDDRFNASPIYTRAGEDVLDRPDTRIYHFHGGKAWTRSSGRTLYLPHYERFLRDNIGNVRAIDPYPRFFKALDPTDRERLKQFLDYDAIPC